MFLYNSYQWPWTRIAGLIAPRPMLFTNSDQDSIFPMDANDRVINRLERLYSLFGAGDRVDAFVSVGGHDYRKDIRQAEFRFLNTYLKNDCRPVEDTEIDLVVEGRNPIHPIPPEELRAFRTDSEIPSDAINGRVAEEFVPMAHPARPAPAEFDSWRDRLLEKLRRMTFHYFPARIPAAVLGREEQNAQGSELRLTTEPYVHIHLQRLGAESENPQRVTLIIAGDDELSFPANRIQRNGDVLFVIEPRGIGSTKWTSKNPPNYVERSHYLLGRTVETGRIWDIIATARYLKSKYPSAPITIAGTKSNAVLAIYAALLEKDISGIVTTNLPKSLMDRAAPALLNALRVCDIPEAIEMLAPRQVDVLP